jgi:4-alpha-glucanotransferase
MLNILALEAHRAGGLVVGEDLGTVTDEARRDLTERQILSYRVWWFERDSPRSWPRNALGAVSTHDLPTVAGVLTGSDIQHQRRLGLEPNEEGSAALQRKLFERTGAGPGTPAEQVIEGVYEDLGQAPCLVLTASLDDVAAVEQRPNMPGTIDEWPNWCIALPLLLEQLEQSSLAAAIAERLNRSQSPPLPPGRA